MNPFSGNIDFLLVPPLFHPLAFLGSIQRKLAGAMEKTNTARNNVRVSTVLRLDGNTEELKKTQYSIGNNINKEQISKTRFVQHKRGVPRVTGNEKQTSTSSTVSYIPEQRSSQNIANGIIDTLARIRNSRVVTTHSPAQPRENITVSSRSHQRTVTTPLSPVTPTFVDEDSPSAIPLVATPTRLTGRTVPSSSNSLPLDDTVKRLRHPTGTEQLINTVVPHRPLTVQLQYSTVSSISSVVHPTRTTVPAQSSTESPISSTVPLTTTTVYSLTPTLYLVPSEESSPTATVLRYTRPSTVSLEQITVPTSSNPKQSTGHHVVSRTVEMVTDSPVTTSTMGTVGTTSEEFIPASKGAYHKAGRGNVDSGIPIRPDVLERLQKEEMEREKNTSIALKEFSLYEYIVGKQTISNTSLESEEFKKDPHRYDTYILVSGFVTLFLLFTVFLCLAICHKKAIEEDNLNYISGENFLE